MRRDDIAAERCHDQRELVEKLEADTAGLVEIRDEAKKLRARRKLVVEPKWHSAGEVRDEPSLRRRVAKTRAELAR